MFRLVSYTKEEKEDSKFLEKTASETIAAGLRQIYGSGNGDDLPNDFHRIMGKFEKQNFFRGLSQYIQAENDMEAGWKLVKLKTVKMIEKMDDPDESYTFDVFEELLFHLAIVRCGDIFRRDRDSCVYFNAAKEKETAQKLIDTYHYTKKQAERAARDVGRFHTMCLKNGQDENMFFWDNDFVFVFQNSFVEGIRFLKGFEGERIGYGYDYTCEMFTEIGLKPPLTLLGTKEANRIRNEEMQKKLNAEMDEIMSRITYPKW